MQVLHCKISLFGRQAGLNIHSSIIITVFFQTKYHLVDIILVFHNVSWAGTHTSILHKLNECTENLIRLTCILDNLIKENKMSLLGNKVGMNIVAPEILAKPFSGPDHGIVLWCPEK